jgi:hypothetical protein
LLLLLLLLLLATVVVEVDEQGPSQRHSNSSTYVFSVMSEQPIDTVESRAAVIDEVTATVLLLLGSKKTRRTLQCVNLFFS